MRKTIFLFNLLALCLLTASAQTVTLTVSNPTAAQRQELIAIDASELPFSAKKGVVVRDAFNIEQASQLTHDGKLLLYVHVRPNGKAVFTIQPGTPAPVASWVGGRQYPERKDDIAFENDRIGFRLYGPALQRTGERGFGHDVWIKRTPELILDELYRHDPMLKFHLDYGKGLDCYGVGPTLGCGTPCLIYSALLFPDQPVNITQQECHALGIMKDYQSGQRFHYFFGAAWSEFDVRSQDEWQLRIDGFMLAQQQPLQITIYPFRSR